MSDTDLELLARYARHHAEDAFAEIVRRHLDLVHSAALRQVRSPQLAQEVAQSTFVNLARHAHRLAPGTVLTAWLYQVTRREAIDVVRREARRQLREQIATEINDMNAADLSRRNPMEADDWTHIEPLLDEAMDALDDTDRAAVLLRYFENKSLREVGATLGTSENAAQKRLARAVERLREFLAKHGVTVGASGLGVVISANAVQAAPVGLAVTISAAALAGTTVSTGAAATATKAIAMTTAQKALVALALTAAIGTGIYEARQASTLREQIQTLQRQQVPLADFDQLRAENQRLTQLQTDADELARLRKDQTELLRLRGEVGVLRREISEAAQREARRVQETAKAVIATTQPKADVPAGAIKFIRADVRRVILPFYSELAWLKVDVSAEVSEHLPMNITLENDRAMTRSEAVSFIEQALREQVGLEVRRVNPGFNVLVFAGKELK